MDTIPSRKPRVAVIFGGRSGEHAISCATAAGVLRAIDRDRYDVVPIGITRTGRWVPAVDDPARWEITDGRLPSVDAGAGHLLPPVSTEDHDLIAVDGEGTAASWGRLDVVLPLLHGPYGEDGTLQGLLELTDTRYVGAGVLASAISMDKHYMKIALAAAGLPVGPFVVFRAAQWQADRPGLTARVAALGLPVFVKPARAGSSLGITKVDAIDDLPAAVAAAAEHDPKVIVEAAVVGREIECAVLGGHHGAPPRTSLPGEIVVTGGHDFYDFEAKYLDEANVELTCPADLPEEVAATVRRMAAEAFTAVDAEGLARVDVFVRGDGSVVVNEINTMPGFTPFSMYPRMWAASGLDYPTLVDELLTLAMERPVGLR